MKIKELFLKVFKTNKSKIIFGIVILMIFLCFILITYNRKSTVDTEQMNLLLSKSSELTAAKLKITAMSEFEDTGISFINRADFTMVYTATVRAGINMDEVKINSDNIAKKNI